MVQPRCSAPLSAIDVAVGRRLRTRRKELNISQEALGELVGVTARRIAAFESGCSRLGPMILMKFCRRSQR